MSFGNFSANSASKKKYLIGIVLFYLFCASIIGFASRYDLNPDMISYLRLSGYVAEGNFSQSVTGWWAPMITWVMAPFLYFGISEIVTTRIVTALSGLASVIGVWFLAGRFIVSPVVKCMTVLISALLVSSWTHISLGLTPDILLTALLMFYLYNVSSPDMLKHKKLAVLCGMFGGLAYLTKHYALPFFLVHFPLTLLLRAYFSKDGKVISLKKVLVPLIIGTVTFLMIVLPWVSLISLKYQKFTIGTAGGSDHAAKAPENEIVEAYGHPSFYGLHQPKNSYAIHTWEDPSEMDYKQWSPFESKKHFIHQLNIIEENVHNAFNYLLFDGPFVEYTFIMVVIALSIFSLLLLPVNKKKKFLYCWALITISIYVFGYMLVAADLARYFYPVVAVAVMLSFHFYEELKNGLKEIKKDRVAGRANKLLVGYISIIFILAFTIKPGAYLLKSMSVINKTDKNNYFGEMAEQINNVDFPWPYAIKRSSRNVSSDLYIAYRLNKQFLGRVLSSDVEGITKELEEAGAKSILIFDNQEIAEKLKNDMRFRHIANLDNNGSAGQDKVINVFILDLMNAGS